MADPLFLPRKILLGVTGSIAAYKSAWLVRELVRAGAEVQVVMTPAARDFVTPLTLSTLSKRPVHWEYVDPKGDGTWTNHVALAEWADLLLIAPITANTLAKMAAGTCDDLLSAVYLSASCPVYVAPAMDLEMFKDGATQKNLNILKDRGVRTIGPDSGELASGLSGSGRMTEPELIVQALVEDLFSSSPLHGKKVLISAGGTQEAIDPVRYIGNRSTGKMGFALAAEATLRGAHVTLVAGPVQLGTPHPGIRRIDVVSAAEMAAACKEHFDESDITIMAAAVADLRPAKAAKAKIKKGVDPAALELEPTEDILRWMGQHRRPGQVLVGFALETDKGMEAAQGKLERKNVDMIVLNTLQDHGAGFGHDTNQVTLITKDKEPEKSALLPKPEVARIILDRIHDLIRQA